MCSVMYLALLFNSGMFSQVTHKSRLIFKLIVAKPHSSVGSVADLRTGGRWFDPQLGQYSFQGLMIIIATGFIPLSPLSIVLIMVM